jgi:hypothetical protein
MANLTKRFIDSLQPPDDRSEVVHWDDKLPGFGVRVRRSGAMTFIIQYRNATGNDRKMKVGTVGRMTVDEARGEARVLLAEVDRNLDPAARRADQRQALTMKELCEQYLAAADRGLVMGKKGRAKKTSTLATDREGVPEE